MTGELLNCISNDGNVKHNEETAVIPYFSLPGIPLPGGVLPASQLLVAIALLVGYQVYVSKVAGRGAEVGPAQWFFITAMASGFVGAHVAKLVVYEPGALIENPLRLFTMFAGLSSFGGFAGATIGGWLFKRAQRISDWNIATYADSAIYAAPFGWTFGRAGCAVAHEHLGKLSNHWLAVQYPDGARWNLGLLEMLFVATIAVVFWILNRRPRPIGFFPALYCFSYGAFRFWMDSLQEKGVGPEWLTVDRLGSVVVVGFGCIAVLKVRKLRKLGGLPWVQETTGRM